MQEGVTELRVSLPDSWARAEPDEIAVRQFCGVAAEGQRPIADGLPGLSRTLFTQ